MARLNPPASAAVVEVPDEHVGRYVTQGWSEVTVTRSRSTEGDSKPAQRRSKSSNK